MGDFFRRFIAFQNELKVPKNQYNKFGEYNYRSAEDILEAVKPLELKHNILIFVSDDVVLCGERIYVKATATAVDATGESEPIRATAFAREQDEKKKMDASQLTGTASS
ncbi:MAG: ERF family protein, partial [Treponema sp.]|nr:ERF family protein [Treponema sp.]